MIHCDSQNVEMERSDHRETKGTNLDSFHKAKDCSDHALALKVMLQMQKNKMENELSKSWFCTLSLMPFVSIVKVLRRLFADTQHPRRLRFLLSTGRGYISSRLEERTPDGAAMTELKHLLNDLYRSSSIYLEQEQTETTRDRVQVVLDGCRLYILIAMTLAKLGHVEYRQLVLEPSELMAAKNWLRTLQEQLSTARVECLTKHYYKYAAKVLKLALQVNADPSEYRGGVPL